MKKYLVWKAGCASTAGVVVKAENSLDARKQVAQERTQHSIKHGTGFHFDAIDFCARVWDEPEVPAPTSRLTQEDADRIETLAKVYAKAAAEKSWAGSQHPEDAANIRQNYVNASRALTAALRELVR